MKIGNQTFAVQARPADLDAQLLESTGCSAEEFAGMLASENVLAGLIASALHPFLSDKGKISVPELATLIAEDGVNVVAPAVLALYAAKPKAQVPSE